MSKLEYQVSKFLEQYDFQSEIDWKAINSFCQVELNLIFEKMPKIISDGIGSSAFFSWYENGFGAGDVAWYDRKRVILGACSLTTAKIEATLSDEQLDLKRFETSVSELSKASEEDTAQFKHALTLHGLQFSEQNLLVVGIRFPNTNERVSFHKAGTRGIGVIKSVSQKENKFELYCYHIYKTDETKYSMNEELSPLSDYTFDIMTISERRRLENRLNKLGKSWNDKMHRIEPVKAKAEKGQKYWYITDKMKMTSAIEEGRPTSHMRYLGGNYFLTAEDCLVNLARINEMLRNFLAR
jgi:hypothetical protein